MKTIEKGMISLVVRLNGTDKNPFHPFGLNQNPFPQISKQEYVGYVLHIQALGGDPIPDTDYIRNHLKGWDPGFVEGLCSRFVKGEMAEFLVEFPE
jgi:hypothetical protein